MWQKVAKFKGAEYFRKALYLYNSSISAHCKYGIGTVPVGCLLSCVFVLPHVIFATLILVTDCLGLELARNTFHCACDIKTWNQWREVSKCAHFGMKEREFGLSPYFCHWASFGVVVSGRRESLAGVGSRHRCGEQQLPVSWILTQLQGINIDDLAGIAIGIQQHSLHSITEQYVTHIQKYLLADDHKLLKKLSLFSVCGPKCWDILVKLTGS